MTYPVCRRNLRNSFEQSIQRALVGRKWPKVKLDKLATRLMQQFVKNNIRHYGDKIKFMDTSIYLVKSAQFPDLILQKQKFQFTQLSGIFLLAAS